MPIVVLVLALVAYAYAMIAAPGFRRWGALLGAAIGLGLGVYFWIEASETTRNASRITSEDITLDQLAFETTGRGANVTGRVQNHSDTWRLREMTLALSLMDCPEPETPVAECPIIGQSTAILRSDVPPGQLRGFSTHFLFTNLPAIAGTLRWSWEITDIRATS